MYDREPVKPEYLWNPRQIWRRVTFTPSDQETALPLPWNCTITSSSANNIGRSIATQGIYDLPLTEAIVRLTDAGETTLDVGANIGYASLVFALASGPRGRVIAFEPNPDLIGKVRANAARWASLPAAPIEIQSVALSSESGEGRLGFPEDYANNAGLASLEETRNSIPVSLRTLDSLGIERAGVMKVDVEGHEAFVFVGANRMLAERRIRDIIFEEHGTYPQRSHELLLYHGYQIFRLTRSTWRPLLLPPTAPPRQAYIPANFLATVDPARALDRFRGFGWRALGRL